MKNTAVIIAISMTLSAIKDLPRTRVKGPVGNTRVTGLAVDDFGFLGRALLDSCGVDLKVVAVVGGDEAEEIGADVAAVGIDG